MYVSPSALCMCWPKKRLLAWWWHNNSYMIYLSFSFSAQMSSFLSLSVLLLPWAWNSEPLLIFFYNLKRCLQRRQSAAQSLSRTLSWSLWTIQWIINIVKGYRRILRRQPRCLPVKDIINDLFLWVVFWVGRLFFFYMLFFPFLSSF